MWMGKWEVLCLVCDPHFVVCLSMQVLQLVGNIIPLFYSRCITNQRPLLESGTMGAKGHVQVGFTLPTPLCSLAH